MHDVNCPYCDAEIEINHDDGYGYEENKTHEQECGKCEKIFIYTTAISFNYYPEKADCKNDDAEHEWENIEEWRYGLEIEEDVKKWHGKQRCKICDDERTIDA